MIPPYLSQSSIEFHLYGDDGPEKEIRHDKPESVVNREEDQNEYGLNRAFMNVSDPVMAVLRAPKEKANGAAIVLFPGGALARVVVDKEGFDVAQKLNDMGITCAIVKYRTQPKSITRNTEEFNQLVHTISQDGKRAIRIMRSKAKEWNIDPQRIGVMGFSAGGWICSLVATHIKPPNDNAADPMKHFSTRPDFVCLVYPVVADDAVKHVSKDTPPMFITVASDDSPRIIQCCNDMAEAMRNVDATVTMQKYATGGHGFGIGIHGGEVAGWLERFREWMIDRKIVEK